MSLIRKRRSRFKWADEQLQKPPSIVRVVITALGAVVCLVLGILQMAKNDQIPGAALMGTLVLGILASEQWRRLRKLQNAGLMPARVHCPECKALICLTMPERRSGQFASDGCHVGFDVTDLGEGESAGAKPG